MVPTILIWAYNYLEMTRTPSSLIGKAVLVQLDSSYGRNYKTLSSSSLVYNKRDV